MEFKGQRHARCHLVGVLTETALKRELQSPALPAAGLQLPPKRRQVIRLPKPPPSEWPKLPKGQRRHADDSEGSASDGGEDEGDGEEGEGAEGAGGSGKPLSAAHRTGLAKCSAIIDWLMTALGVRSGGRGVGGGARPGQGPAGGREGHNLCKVTRGGDCMQMRLCVTC